MFALRNHPRGPRRRSAEADREALAARVCAELADDLPDEDLTQDLDDCLDRYELGSKPRCEEVEYLEMVQDAIDRIERGR
ncbi:hypothetical protein [Streptomyces roseoverticillatus]|uniref:hypothetical protein n=1 Tax=Streptomyces roseoverticillatus TaxID=66429 RepID=UPI0004C1FBD0|nr:hypothetical protein [Streptomyces roseoverticillatus]